MVQVDYDSPERRSPEQIRALARAYNAKSAQLQAAAGIEPALAREAYEEQLVHRENIRRVAAQVATQQID